MKLDPERQGEIFIFAEASLWGLFPVVTVLTYSKLSSLIALAASSFFAALFFAVNLTLKKRWHEIFNRKALKDTLLATFFLGIIYYLFYFFGLRHTTPGNASIIALTEIFFSFLFFHVFRKDYIPIQHVIGSVLMVIGVLIVLFPRIHEFHTGDLLILVASAIAPFGNFFVRHARKIVSSESIMFTRSILSSAVIFSLAYIFHTTSSLIDLKNSLLFLTINGFFLLGLSKVFWIEGIHRISVTKANALTSISPLITLFFAWGFLKNTPTIWQLVSFVPMFVGILLLSQKR